MADTISLICRSHLMNSFTLYSLLLSKETKVRRSNTHVLCCKIFLSTSEFVAGLVVELVARCECDDVCFTVSTTPLSHFDSDIVHPANTQPSTWFPRRQTTASAPTTTLRRIIMSNVCSHFSSRRKQFRPANNTIDKTDNVVRTALPTASN